MYFYNYSADLKITEKGLYELYKHKYTLKQIKLCTKYFNPDEGPELKR